VRCPTGEARATPGFRLKARHVIHTVGPIWRGGDAGEPELLAGCYRSSLALACELSVESIAFPAISCGVYGYPVAQAAALAVQQVRAVVRPNRVVFCCFGAEMAAVYRSELARE
jgi:O-acetyl-ADP-ribose deacetylase (regulator of RNase III)